MAESAQEKLFQCLFPILNVVNVPDSLAYYIQTLGFKEDWSIGTMAQVSRDGFGIMLNQEEVVHPQEVWIGVRKLEPLHEEFLKSGVLFSQEPQNHPWAYDMKVSDPDGHSLWFGAGPKDDQPFVE